ncbi:hypothetical protein TRAPUB_9421 [Trametes pubescens]|uniref:Uncharacterized protein n=1 Tax=Trametes pubescens TaxID=154538 RepID=A0A1M2W2E5_TRAPU|nr:hypothetical protein TRAPUB_9421 [Trametes pubescens]
MHPSIQPLDSRAWEQTKRWFEQASPSEWLEVLPGLNAHALDGHAGDRPTTASVDHFERDFDRANLNGALGQTDAAVPLLNVDDPEWSRWLDLPQSPHASSSVYSDDLATLPASPYSMVSDDTAVDRIHSLSPKFTITEDFARNGQLSNLPAAEPYGYPVGAFEQGPLEVMYSVPPGYGSPFESDPFAFSFRRGVGAGVQPQQQQQHLIGAAASAQRGMSMPAGDYVVPLTFQHFPDVPETRTEVVLEGGAPTAATTSRKGASSADGEKSTKKRKQQSTEKTIPHPRIAPTSFIAAFGSHAPIAPPVTDTGRAFWRATCVEGHYAADRREKGARA